MLVSMKRVKRFKADLAVMSVLKYLQLLQDVLRENVYFAVQIPLDLQIVFHSILKTSGLRC